MLNRLFQAAGMWEKAIGTATNQDRIHLKTTHYQYAKHLESIGHTDEAIEVSTFNRILQFSMFLVLIEFISC